MMDNEENMESGSLSMIRHKIVFVGNVAVGKTSIIFRFIENKFVDNYEPSIGVDFWTRPLKFRGKNLRLTIWDSAGQERYKSLVQSYVRGSSIVFIVYDVSKRSTFESVPEWINFVKNAENPMIVLCGNKTDLERLVDYEEGEKLADKEGLLFFEVSAKSDDNIKKMVYTAVSELPFFDNYLAKNVDKEKLISELEEENCNESKMDAIINPTPSLFDQNQIRNKTKKECNC